MTILTMFQKTQQVKQKIHCSTSWKLWLVSLKSKNINNNVLFTENGTVEKTLEELEHEAELVGGAVLHDLGISKEDLAAIVKKIEALYKSMGKEVEKAAAVVAEEAEEVAKKLGVTEEDMKKLGLSLEGAKKPQKVNIF